MTRVALLTTLVAVGVTSLVVSAAQQSARPRQPARQIVRIKEDLYLIPSSDGDTYDIGGHVPEATARTGSTGGNTLVWVTSRGVVLVDTMNPGYGSELIAQVKTVTNKPVTTIINSHTHFDHTGSNIEFPATVDFVAQENTKADLAQANCAPVTNCAAFKGENVKFLPKRTFKDKMTLFEGKDRIDLYYFGLGHTNGDTWIVFPAVHAMHTGDMFQRKNMPFIDAADSGGNALDFAQTLNKALAAIKGVETIIPGHSPTTMTWADLKEYTGYYGEFVAAVKTSKKAGQTADQAAKAYKPSDQYRLYETDASRVKQNVEDIYRRLQ